MKLMERSEARTVLAMPGLEADNLLAFLALLGLLRSLEASQPEWNPRVFWQGPPWTAQLVVTTAASEGEIAAAANAGILSLAQHFYIEGGRKNVDFTLQDYCHYAEKIRERNDPIAAALASALTADCAPKQDGGLSASPLVMMFGQGHQNFLERLVDIPTGELPNRLRKIKNPPDLTAPVRLVDALFRAWRREDDTDGFRWDPEEDQRYALQYEEPSKAGAALTVTGANRLASVGFLSFPSVARQGRIKVSGVLRRGEWFFVWPIWTIPLTRFAIEALLNHPDLVEGQLTKLRMFGIAEIFRAERVSNAKSINVARAQPIQT